MQEHFSHEQIRKIKSVSLESLLDSPDLNTLHKDKEYFSLPRVSVTLLPALTLSTEQVSPSAWIRIPAWCLGQVT